MPGHRFFAAMYDRLMSRRKTPACGRCGAELIAGRMVAPSSWGPERGSISATTRTPSRSWSLTEPDPFMAAGCATGSAAKRRQPGGVEVIEAAAEALPFEDASFDTVVSTLVLCTVDDPERAAAEIARVLRPGGRLLYIEHVRDAAGGGLARLQDRLERPWGWFAGGCHPNRDTAATLAAVGSGGRRRRTGSPAESTAARAAADPRLGQLAGLETGRRTA